jgi:predicted permease
LLWLALNLRRDRNRLHGRGPTPKRLSNMETLYADLRWSLRLFRRRPGFAFTVCSTLAVAVAAAATAYGLARSVLWRPLPYPDESSLVFVWEVAEREGARLPMRVTGSRFDHWQRTSTSFASLAAFGAAAFSGEGPEGVTNLRGVRVSTNYFQTLGIAPALGRDFVAEDGVAGRNRVVLLSHAFWQQWFGGRRDVVGTTIRLSGESYTILGVMPPVVFPAWPANPAIVTLDQSARMFWVPIASAQLAGNTRAHVLGVVGRLRPHASRPQAEAELGAASPTAVDRHAARLIPFRDQFVEDARTPLLALLGAALAVLLTACANLAALQATSFESRRAELGIRLAVGAGRLRLARQLATESLVLALAAGAAGLALARLALTTLPPSLPPEVPFLTAPDLDGQVAAFGLAISLLAGACLAAWPIARAHGTSPTGRGVASSSSTMFRSLVAVQVALAMALAV